MLMGKKFNNFPKDNFFPRADENYKEKDKRGALICRNVFLHGDSHN